MPEVDLVPRAYRRWLLLRRWSWILGLALVTVVVVLAGTRLLLATNVHTLGDELAALRQREQALFGQQVRLDALREREQALASRVDLLDRLRGGLPTMSVFQSVDAALDGRVWFREWSFQRAGEYVPATSTAAGANVILVPRAGDGSAPRAWRMRTHMEIEGQALDHSALADFVRRLGAQTAVSEVRVLDTHVRRYSEVQVVNFRLAVILAARDEA